MKIWIHLDGIQQGPFEMSELPLDRMTPSTPVWYEGLEYWVEAGKAPLTADLFQPVEEVSFDIEEQPTSQVYEKSESDPQETVHNTAYTPRNEQQQYAAYGQATTQQPKCPSTYLVWSILLTVICCNPIGIVAIIMGSRVNTKYRNYDYEGAKRASDTTAWWLIITIVTSIIMAPLSILMAF